MSEMKRTAAELKNIPRRGIVSACKIPPNADSLKAQSAVIFKTLKRTSEFSLKINILSLIVCID
jgi:hypothetical protein